MTHTRRTHSTYIHTTYTNTHMTHTTYMHDTHVRVKEILFSRQTNNKIHIGPHRGKIKQPNHW